jgi:hypothetical protein
MSYAQWFCMIVKLELGHRVINTRARDTMSGEVTTYVLEARIPVGGSLEQSPWVFLLL